jgi:hypothetical protein
MRENKLTTPLSTRPSSLGGKIDESLHDFLGHGCYKVRYGNLLRAALCKGIPQGAQGRALGRFYPLPPIPSGLPVSATADGDPNWRDGKVKGRTIAPIVWPIVPIAPVVRPIVPIAPVVWPIVPIAPVVRPIIAVATSVIATIVVSIISSASLGRGREQGESAHERRH